MLFLLSDSLTCRKTICPLYLITAFDLYRIVLDRCHNDIIPDFLRCQHINRVKERAKEPKGTGSAGRAACLHDTVYTDQKDRGAKESYLGLVGREKNRYSKEGQSA